MKKKKVIYPEELIRKYRIITLVKERKMKQKQAAKELNLSVRQIKRLVKNLRKSGGSIDSLRHQRNCPAWNRVPDPIRDKVAKLKNKERNAPASILLKYCPAILPRKKRLCSKYWVRKMD